MGAPLVYDYIRYEPKTFRLLFSDGTTRDIDPKTISRISLEYHYNDLFLPIYKVEFSTDIATYLKIVQDKTKVTVQFRLDFYPYTRDKEKDTRVRTFHNDKFALYLLEDSPELHKELNEVIKEQNKAGGDETSDAVSNKFLNLAVFLFKESHLNWAYGNVNGVIIKASMTDVITYVLQSLGMKGIMTPLDNSSVYDQIYLPPLTRVDLFKYLNAQYGFYEYGYHFFIDFDKFYFLSKKKGCTAWIPREYKKIIFNVRKSDDGDRFADGSKLVEKESTVYINVLPSKIMAEAPSIFNNMIIGNALTSIRTYTNTISRASYETVQRGQQLQAYLDNKYNNPYAEKEFAHSLERESRIITFHLSMSNLHWYRPNKQFIINFENANLNKLYGGEYKLNSMVAILYNSGDFMENDIIVQFKK